jgi:pimeloyl-ACP methyl ester carboxylesterase
MSGIENGPRIMPTVQEVRSPVVNVMQVLERKFERDRLTYAEHRKIRPVYGYPLEIDRPLSARFTQARLADQADEHFRMPQGKSRTEGLRGIITEARERNDITRQFFTQGELRIPMGDMGVQSARYTVLEPAPSKLKERPELAQLPPVFFIPGISGDIETVESLAEELAYSGRRVIVVAHPESTMGHITPQFVEQVQNSPDYRAHTEFFTRALYALCSQPAEKEGDTPVLGPVELQALSTGCPIVKEMLDNEEIAQNVTNAVLYSPASSADVSLPQMGLGLLDDARQMFKHRRAPMWSFIWGRVKNPDDDPQDLEEQGKLKGAVFNAVLGKVRTHMDWDDMHVAPGGRIVVVSGERDGVTRNREQFSRKNRPNNPQMRIIHVPKGRHSSPLLYPAQFINKVNEVLAA